MARLEPLSLLIDQRDERYGRTERACGAFDQIVEHRFVGAVENAVRLQVRNAGHLACDGRV
jgi:hypothetical protein